MNKLSATELKRRGIAAVEESLRNGPVRLTKNNKPCAVVLTEDQYARLVERAAARTSPRTTDLSGLLKHSKANTKR
jgi:prevent-host-death family protein